MEKVLKALYKIAANQEELGKELGKQIGQNGNTNFDEKKGPLSEAGERAAKSLKDYFSSWEAIGDIGKGLGFAGAIGLGNVGADMVLPAGENGFLYSVPKARASAGYVTTGEKTGENMKVGVRMEQRQNAERVLNRLAEEHIKNPLNRLKLKDGEAAILEEAIPELFGAKNRAKLDKTVEDVANDMVNGSYASKKGGITMTYNTNNPNGGFLNWVRRGFGRPIVPRTKTINIKGFEQNPGNTGTGVPTTYSALPQTKLNKGDLLGSFFGRTGLGKSVRLGAVFTPTILRVVDRVLADQSDRENSAKYEY